MSKLDQIRALRERNFAESQTVRKPMAKAAKLKMTKAVVKWIETLSRDETLTVEKLSVSCSAATR